MDYTPIIEALFKLALTIISVVIIPLLLEKIGNEKYKKLLSYIDMFVASAEQIFNQDETFEKKNYVVNALKELGYKITAVTDDQIEAAVIKLHNILASGLYQQDKIDEYFEDDETSYKD